MYDVEMAAIETLRAQFDREIEARDPNARATGARYTAALTAFVDAFNAGPGADPRQMGHDTTGALDRLEAQVVWAEAERHRVRTALADVA